MNRQDRRTRTRVHIFTGMLAGFVFLIAAALTASGAEPPKKLVIANISSYSTSIIATAKPDATETVTINISDVVLYGSGVTLTVPVGGADYARNVGPRFEHSGIFLVDAPVDADLSTVLSFSDGLTRSSFGLCALGAVTWDHSAIVGPLISDAVEGAWITVFPSQPQTPIWIVVRDAKHPENDEWEMFNASPPVTQYRLTTPGISYVEVFIGDPWFDCLPFADCRPYGAVYGFGSTGTPDGGNFRAFPFK